MLIVSSPPLERTPVHFPIAFLFPLAAIAAANDTLAVWDFANWNARFPLVSHGAGRPCRISADGDQGASALDDDGEGIVWDGNRSPPLEGSGCADLDIRPGRKVRLEARIFLSHLPGAGLHNARAVVAGFYEGPKILVTSQGGLQAGGQRGRDGAWDWYAPESRPEAVPLGRWTELAIEGDADAGEWKAWVDGTEVPIAAGPNGGGILRPSFGSFMVGSDPHDFQPFPGRISAVRILAEKPVAKGASASPMGSLLGKRIALHMEADGIDSSSTRAVSDLLAESLRAQGFLVVDLPEPPAVPCLKAACAASLGDQAGADLVVTGSARRLGNSTVLVLRLVGVADKADMGSRARQIFGGLEKVGEALDGMARELCRKRAQ
jgi:Concanavalin A-like lectin/glucanases superfamily